MACWRLERESMRLADPMYHQLTGSDHPRIDPVELYLDDDGLIRSR
jgi:hypothetical protein